MRALIIFLIVFIVNLFAVDNYDKVGTDYSNTITEEYGQEDSLEALKTVNMILDFIQQTKIDNFINQGPYVALLKNKGEGGSAEAQSNGINAKTEKLLPMTLIVERNATQANAPMKVKIWMDDKSDDGPMKVVGYINVEKGISNEYPLGKFRLDIKGYLLTSSGDVNTSANIMKNVLVVDKANTSGYASIKYKETFYEGNQDVNQSLNMLIDPNAGKGELWTTIFDMEESSQPLVYKIKFNEDAYYITLGNQHACKSKTDFIKVVYRYKLFNANDGSEVRINGGMPIYKDANSKRYYGYIGYWGLWSENNSIVAGDSVKKEGTNESYTVKQTKGKLIKHTKSTIKMEKLSGAKMFVWTYLGSDTNTNANYAITWDADNEVFTLLGIQQCNDNGCDINTSIVTNDNKTYNDLNISDWTQAWVPAINSNIPLKNLRNDTDVSYYKEEVIIPDDNMTLVNFGYEIINPDMNLSVAQNDANYKPEAIESNATNGVIGNYYKYDAQNSVLLDMNRSNKEVVIPSDTNWSNASNHPYWKWGARIEPLLIVKSSYDDNNNNPASYNQNNYWQVTQNASVYYTWETGLNNWNKTAYLQDSNGENITFEPPLTMLYTHATENDLNGDSTHNNQVYTINYDGDSLGLPGHYNRNLEEWMPEINIKAGTKMGDNERYVVKPIEIGLYPEDSANGCNGITDDVTLGAPDVDFNDSVVDVNGLVDPTHQPDANITVIKGKIISQ